jgi:predicted alpha/beta superfamily hydrolase
MIIVLDGDDQFAEAGTAARALSTSGNVPPLLLLGVGYGGGYRAAVNKRGRDYTPTKRADEPMENGGAEAFHCFLASELLPWASSRFELMEGDYGITGNSLSGLFVLYALLRSRPVFRRGLAGSPSIWWDDRSILGLAAASPPAAGAAGCRLFLCAGADDSPSMAGDLALLSQQLALAPRENLEWTADRFPGLDHYTALPSSFRSGLRWLYADAV